MMSKLGKPSEVADGHIEKIMSLPYINSTCHSPYVYKIDEFTGNLLESVQAIGILTENNEYVRLALDKLQWVKEDLIRMDNG